MWSRLLLPVFTGNRGTMLSQCALSQSCLKKANKTWKIFYIAISLKKTKINTFFFLLDLKEWICAMVPTLLHER